MSEVAHDDKAYIGRLKSEVWALRQDLAVARQRAFQECWDKVNSLIVHGPIENSHRHSERNGLILATNAIRALIDAG